MPSLKRFPFDRLGLALILSTAILSTVTLSTAAIAGAPPPLASHGVDVQTCDWSPDFHVSGPNERVYASVVFDDGTGPALYVGGRFNTVDRSAISGVARWDGTSWSAVGAGFSGDVFALTVYDDGSGPALYAGGNMSYRGEADIRRIAKWDGEAWSGIGAGGGTGFSPVYALAVFDDGSGPKLAAGGAFGSIGSVVTNSIAAWNGSTWQTLGTGTDAAGGVSSLLSHDGTLYAAGYFSRMNGHVTPGLAAWDGTDWSAVGNAQFSFLDLHQLAIFDDGGGPDLYVAGDPAIGGSPVDHRVLRWDGVSWQGIGHDFIDGLPLSLAVHDDGSGPVLMISGADFDVSNTQQGTTYRLGSWDGTTWTDEDAGLATTVYTMATFDDGSGPDLIVGGLHATGGDVGSVKQRATGGPWTLVTGQPGGLGMGGSVDAFATFDDGSGPALYAAGRFRGAGDVAAYSIARWGGDRWETVGPGLDAGTVGDLVVYDDGSGPALYAGGRFRIGSSGPTYTLARWDGTSWTPISGFGTQILQLAVFDAGGGPLLIATGLLAPGTGQPERIASWDGTTWTAIGTDFDDQINRLAVFDDGSGSALYAVGPFTHTGDGAAQHIARWDGATWSAVGGGLADDAHVARVYDDSTGARLWVGGSTGSVGTLTTWDGTSWSPKFVPPGARSINNLEVLDLGDGPTLYVGGLRTDFSTYLAHKTPAGWSTLDLDGGNSVQAIASLDDPGFTGVLVGGSWATTGSIVSSRIALSGPCTSSITFADGFEDGTLDAWLVVQ